MTTYYDFPVCEHMSFIRFYLCQWSIHVFHHHNVSSNKTSGDMGKVLHQAGLPHLSCNCAPWEVKVGHHVTGELWVDMPGELWVDHGMCQTM